MASASTDPKLIESIPPAVLKTLPAGAPPQGIQPNFIDPSTRVPVILGVSIVFAVLAFFCFSIRIYTKLAIAKKWKWDDLTCSLGFMCSIGFFVSLANGCVNGGTGRHIWDLHLDKVLNKSALYQDYITTILATPALGLIKFSLFIQYYVLFRPSRWVRISVWIGATISAVFYVAVSITAFVLNSPWPGETLFEDILSSHYFKFEQFSIPTGVIGMLVDWYLLILPIPAVLGLQMSTARKFGVLIVFMTGGLAAIASIITLYYRVYLQKHLSDSTWNVSYVSLFSEIEMFAGVAASSMPTVHLFFARQNFSLTSWMSSLKSNLTQMLSSSTAVKLPDNNPSFTDWGGSNMQNSKDHERFRMNDLESDGCERKVAKPPPVGTSQIRLTQDISINRENLDDTSFRSMVTGRSR